MKFRMKAGILLVCLMNPWSTFLSLDGTRNRATVVIQGMVAFCPFSIGKTFVCLYWNNQSSFLWRRGVLLFALHHYCVHLWKM